MIVLAEKGKVENRASGEVRLSHVCEDVAYFEMVTVDVKSLMKMSTFAEKKLWRLASS